MQTVKENDSEQAAPMVTLMSGLGSEDEDGCVSSPGSAQFDDGGDLMAAAMGDEVTAQLAAAGLQNCDTQGPVGVAAAAAIVSAKKRKRPHSFETNPSIRKRQQNRLLRKLKQTIDEFATRVGQQAVVVVATPGKPTNSFKVFGAKPLEDVMKNIRCVIMEELESALAQQAPPPVQDDPSLYELPPLVIDGIPTPVEKMTQAQLRAFIPLMLKYSTGRGKPGWGRDSTRPAWWPKDLPWANVRMDARSEEEKHKISWTHALRQIVINCYKYHGREDLLPAFSEEDEKQALSTTTTTNTTTSSGGGKVHTKAIEVVDGGESPSSTLHATQVTAAPAYTQTILQTISNPDGTVSIIQVDPSNPIITLPDGTTAQVQGVATLTQGDGIGALGESVELNGVSTDGGQIILTGEDGHGFPVSVSGMITVPVPPGMYQTVVQQLPSSEAGTAGEDRLFQVVAPMQVHVPKVEPNNDETTVATSGATSDNGSESVATAASANVEAILGAATHQVVTIGGDAQVLQVLSLKESTQVTQVLKSPEIKEESPNAPSNADQ